MNETIPCSASVRRVVGAALTILLWLQMPIARAAPADTSMLEEVVVTAQKRAQDLQDVPIAVTVVGGATVERAGIRDLHDLQRLTTSLAVAPADTSSQMSFSIRGLSTSGFNAGLESAVGVVVDGVFRGRQVEAVDDLVDIDQIEVLRGPQSTLFGKNTTAGVVSIRSKAPTFQSGGFAEATVGNFGARTLSAGVNIPITASTAAFRIAGTLNERDGFIENLTDGRRVNDRHRGSVRAQLLLEPTSTLSVRLIADHAGYHEHCCAAPFFYNDPSNIAVIEALGGTLVGGSPYSRQVRFNGGLYARESNSGISAQIDWNIGWAQLTNITAFRYYDQYDETDVDYTDRDLISYNASSSVTRSFSQELRLASRGHQRLDWLGGLYYSNQHLTSGGPDIYGRDLRPFVDLLSEGYVGVLEEIMGLPTGTFFAPGQGLENEHYVQRAATTAIFGNVDLHLADRWTLSGGLRYETATKHVRSDIRIDDPFAAIDFNTFLGGAFAPLSALQFFPPVANFDKSMRESDVSGKATIAYALRPTLNFYTSFAHGVKAGGFNLSTTAAQGGFSFKPERVDALEAGFKSRLLDGRLTANVALFDERVRDYQANVFNGIAFILQNAGRIRLRGADREVAAQPWRPLTLEFGASYLLGTIETFSNGPCPLLATTPSCDLSGKRVPDAPRWTLAAAGLFSQPLGDGLTGYTRIGAHVRTSRYLLLSNEPRSLVPTTRQVDASLGLRSDSDRWDVSIWAHNLTNAEFPQGMFNSVALSGSLSGFPADPRTYGLTLRARF